jgi:hypothetical protein
MKTNLKVLAIAGLLVWGIEAGHAGPVAPLTTFTAGTAAKASEVNGNFSAVSTAVNNNDARIKTLEATVSGGNVAPTGNIVLVPSTATAGNILKGTTPFIHNFGTDNTFIGVNAGNFTMTNGGNTASGASALFRNTRGLDNTAHGAFALFSNTDGSLNSASGVSALRNNTTGNNNTASGVNALLGNTEGAGNSASGTGALQSNTTGNNNTASGSSALRNNTIGSFNTATGSSALQSNTIGSSNIAIGAAAGASLTTGDNNIDIGNLGVAAEAFTIRIGDLQTRTFIAGIRGVTTDSATAIPVLIDGNGQLGTASSSRRVKDDIADMGEASRALMKLRPVTFHYKSDKNFKGRTLQYGLVAEEVAKVAPGLVARSADGRIETVYYQFLAPMLLNEYQKQQRTIEAQAAQLAKQTGHIEAQGAEIAELKRQAARMAELLGRPERLTAAVLPPR